MSVSVVIASRGRAELLRQTLTTLVDGMTLPDTQVVVAIDRDDATTYAGGWPNPERIIWSIADREDSLGAKFNRAWRTHKADLYVGLADDMTMPDRGWDATLERASKLLPDACGIVLFGKIEGVLQPGIAMTHAFTEAMGHFNGEQFPFWWAGDTAILEIATMAGCYVHTDVRVTLLNEIKGASRGVREIEFWARLFDGLRPQRRAVAEKIIRAGSRPDNEKAQLLTSLDEWVRKWERSNSILRDPVEATRLEKYYAFDNEPTDRYLRLKAQAEKMMEGLT